MFDCAQNSVNSMKILRGGEVDFDDAACLQNDEIEWRAALSYGAPRAVFKPIGVQEGKRRLESDDQHPSIVSPLRSRPGGHQIEVSGTLRR